MQNRFVVDHLGQQHGPFSLDEILSQVKSGQLEITDYLYNESSSDWVMLLAYEALADTLKDFKPWASAPKASVIQVPTESKEEKQVQEAEWFVLKGENRFGPFTYFDLVRMLQERSLFDFDYLWTHQLGGWKRVSELNEFKSDVIRQLIDSGQLEIKEIFFRRRHARVEYGAALMVHDNKKLWRAQSIEISQGGAGIIAQTDTFQQGQRLFLHFKPGDGVPPFNASCEVVSKRPLEGGDFKGSVKYGVRFTNINPQAQRHLNEFTNRKSAA